MHPLVRNAVYESLSEHERGLAHAEAAEKLRELGAPVEQVAAQVLAAPPETVSDATAVLREAAARAAAEAGLDSAVSYLSRALEEPLVDEERGEVLLELAASEASVGALAVIAHLRRSSGVPE